MHMEAAWRFSEAATCAKTTSRLSRASGFLSFLDDQKKAFSVLSQLPRQTFACLSLSSNIPIVRVFGFFFEKCLFHMAFIKFQFDATKGNWTVAGFLFMALFKIIFLVRPFFESIE